VVVSGFCEVVLVIGAVVVGAAVVVIGYGVLFSHPTADGQLQTFKLVSN